MSNLNFLKSIWWGKYSSWPLNGLVPWLLVKMSILQVYWPFELLFYKSTFFFLIICWVFYWVICLFLIDLLEFFIYSGCLSLICDINCGYFLPGDSCSSLFMVSAAVLKFCILTEHILQSLLLHCLPRVALFSAVGRSNSSQEHKPGRHQWPWLNVA